MRNKVNLGWKRNEVLLMNKWWYGFRYQKHATGQQKEAGETHDTHITKQ